MQFNSKISRVRKKYFCFMYDKDNITSVPVDNIVD